MCEKIRLYARDHLDFRYAKYVDKLEVKDLLIRCCGAGVLRFARVLSLDPFAPEFRRTPPVAILKATHGSGMNKILDASTDTATIHKWLARWKLPYNPTTERQYATIQPRFFIEELINGGRVWTVMVRCLYGQPFSIGVSHTTRPAHRQNYYTTDWKPVQPGQIEDLLPPSSPPPASLALILQESRRLAASFEFVRVDFMLPDLEHGPIYFGELTFSPAAGLPVYIPAVEAQYGALWKA
jgi:hypothetical protein